VVLTIVKPISLEEKLLAWIHRSTKTGSVLPEDHYGQQQVMGVKVDEAFYNARNLEVD
jgi:hypothetical protein